MHGRTEEVRDGGWKPGPVWIALAAAIILYSAGSNLIEILYAWILGDERAMLVPNILDRLFDDAARMLMFLVGLMIFWRAWGRRSAFMLGLGLASLATFPISYLELGPVTGAISIELFNFFLGSMVYLIPAFAIARLEESGIKVPPVLQWVFRLGLAYAVFIWVYILLLRNTDIPRWQPLLWGYSTVRMAIVPYVLAMAVLFVGWMRSRTQDGQRMFLLLLAVSIIIAGNLTFVLFNDNTGIFPRAVTNTSSLFRTVGSLLFAYAILKHRVIDVGFAINRTLVYGAVAFTILVVFGLVEYLAKITIPHAWPQAGSVVTAVIAVLLFLSFHHLHHWFEHHIERLFFHKWHLAEGALKRFVGSAGQFAKAEALCSEFVDELRNYAEGAATALYIRREGGDFALAAGNVAGASSAYAEEDRAFALMRAEREPIDLARAHSTLPGALVAPMLDQQGLAGFVLLGPKSEGGAYRPDELDNIGWAAHQVGLDLQALHARTLGEEIAGLRSRLAATEQERDRLLASLAATKA